jgi:hypothetical protein
MVVIENILILALFGGALGYLIKKGSDRFILKNGKNQSGCSSCSSGSCNSIPDFEKYLPSDN